MIKCTKCWKDTKDTDFYTRSDRNSLESWCKKCVAKKKKAHYESTKTSPKARWAFAKKHARKAKRELTIKEDQYYGLIKQPCFYCKNNIAHEVGIGLDRIDNDKGYDISNVVTCCGPCNLGRQDIFTHKEWQVMINALIKFRMEG